MVSQQELFMIYNNFILMATRWKIGKRGREEKKWSRANIKSPQKMLHVQRHGRAQWFFWLPSSSCPAFKSWLLQILLFCTPMILVALHGGTLLKKETSTTYFQQRGPGFDSELLPLSSTVISLLITHTRSTRSSHLSSARSQCCLTSVFEWEIVYQTLHGH